MFTIGCAERRATAAGFARATGSAAARASKLFGVGARSGVDRAATGIPSALTVGNTGRRTVPQIFIAGQSVGGYEELAELDRGGQLDVLLADG